MPRVSERELIHKAATQAAKPGAAMARPPGLRQRGGSWEIRVRTPKRLRSLLPTEIVKSLGGISTREANRLGWIERANVERRFEEAEVQLGLTVRASPPAGQSTASLSEAELRNAARRHLQELEANSPAIPLGEEKQRELLEATIDDAINIGQPNALNDPTLQATAERFAELSNLRLSNGEDRYALYAAIQEAEIEHLNRRLERLRGATVATINPAFAGVNAQNGGEEIGTTVAEAVTMYIEAPERSANAASSRKMDRSRLGALRDILGGSRPISSITKADMRGYVEQLMKLPRHYTQRYPSKSPAEAIKAGEKDNAPVLSPTSIKRDIQAVRSFFAWLEKQDVIEKNPAFHIEGPRAPKRSERRPFTTDEMKAFLQATDKTGEEKLDWRYWSTRITMLHGFRITEPLGLQVKDLVQQGDIWVIRLRPNKFRSLKTDDTARDVPLHPQLIKLGILGLLKDRDPEELLIPGVPLGEGKTQFNLAQKRMARLVREKVSTDPNLTFHSLRHSFRDAMRDLGFPRGVEERLGGWKSSGNDAMEGYGRGHRLEVLREWIAKIAYEGVEID